MQPKKKRVGTHGPTIDPDKDIDIVLSNMDVYDKILSGS